MNHLENNLKINLEVLKNVFHEPELRYIQLLWAMHIVNHDDRFYELSSETLKKVKAYEGGAFESDIDLKRAFLEAFELPEGTEVDPLCLLSLLIDDITTHDTIRNIQNSIYMWAIQNKVKICDKVKEIFLTDKVHE